MRSQFTIPVLYPLQPDELVVEAISENGRVTLIQAVMEGILVEFSRDADGLFKTKSHPGIERSYLSYVERQLNRRFA